MTERARIAESVEVVEVDELHACSGPDGDSGMPPGAGPRRPPAGRIILGAGAMLCVAAGVGIALIESLRPQRYEDIALTGTLPRAPGEDPRGPCELHIDVTPERDAVGRVLVACGGVLVLDAPRSASSKARTTRLFAPPAEDPKAVNGAELRLEWTGALAGDGRGSVSIDTASHLARIVVERPGQEPETWNITLSSEPRPPRRIVYDL